MRWTLGYRSLLLLWGLLRMPDAHCTESASALSLSGSVIFTAHGGGLVDAPVFDIDRSTRLSGPGFLVQLMYRPASASSDEFVAWPETQTFRTGAAAGYWVPIAAYFPYFPPDGAIIVQARVWEAAAGSFENAVAGGSKYGVSNPVRLIPEFGLGVSTLPVGLQSFSLIPEPSPVALGLAALGCWVGWGLVRRFRWQGRISASR